MCRASVLNHGGCAMLRYPRDRSALSNVVLPVLAATCALAIFVLDTVTELEIAVAALYVAVVLMAVSFSQARGVLGAYSGRLAGSSVTGATSRPASGAPIRRAP
jgi:hypothetical protein